MKFKVGDVVQLKSGGPEMTIKHIHDPDLDYAEGSVLCRWFARGILEDLRFDVRTLNKCEIEEQ